MKGRGGRTTDGESVWMHREEGRGGRLQSAEAALSCAWILGVSTESQTARTSGEYPAKQLLGCYLFLLETVET